MELNIGKKIKELRKEQDVTQEKLAAYLNISYQAISKWENGTAYPDITLVPRIANFFNVSADTLLDMHQPKEDKKLEEAQIVYNDNNNKGKISDNITLCRNILSEYPRNYKWMNNLALMLTNYYDTYRHDNKTDKFIDEAINICERILEDCTVDSIRHSTIQLLCILYPEKGKVEEALRLANQMPSLYMSKDMLLSMIYRNEELIKHEQSTLIQLIDLCADSLVTVSFNRRANATLSYEEKIQYIEASNTLYKTIFINDEDSLFYCYRLCWNYRRLAELWCAMGNKEKAIENLLLAEKCALSYDKADVSGKQKYKSLFVNRCEYDPKHTSKNIECTQTSMLYYRTTENVFDALRDTPEFIQLRTRLQK